MSSVSQFDFRDPLTTKQLRTLLKKSGYKLFWEGAHIQIYKSPSENIFITIDRDSARIARTGTEGVTVLPIAALDCAAVGALCDESWRPEKGEPKPKKGKGKPPKTA